jgi:hypothetical protein
MPWMPDRALAIGVAVLAVPVGVGLGTDLPLAGYFGLSALIAAVACPWRQTAALGALAVVTAIASGVWDDRFGTSQHVAAVILVVAQSAVAVWIAVYRTRRESELRQVRAVADVAQRALLPDVPATMDGARFSARYVSAAEEASVGGDLYEVVATANTIRMIIGDVRGKGLPAVRLASVVLGAFREAAVTWLDQEQVASACARAVSRVAEPEDFVTALLVDIQPDGRLSLCSAGHHAPLLLCPDGTSGPLRLASPSPPLGLAERFAPSAARWDVEDRLLLFTDGLIEARSADGTFFPLEQNLDTLRGGPLDEALDRLIARVTAHVGGNLRDDLAMLLVERHPLDVEQHPQGRPRPAGRDTAQPREPADELAPAVVPTARPGADPAPAGWAGHPGPVDDRPGSEVSLADQPVPIAGSGRWRRRAGRSPRLG